MNAMQLLTGPLSQSIGWALLHLLWQATIVAGILAAVLALLPRQAAASRYAAACSAMALVFAMFVATAIRAYDPGAAPVVPASPGRPAETVTISLAEVPAMLAATATADWRSRALRAVAMARQSLPAIVGLWLAGVALLSARLLVSWMRARQLVTRGTREASARWQSAAARLSEALGLTRAVRLLESAAVEVPSVLGSLRPVILLPASTLTGLTPEQIEMVLAHELAHIRRHDFLVNLMQAFVETLMFYHPAIWWMSRSVRIERENCCDDLAVAVCGNPIQYARALTRLEELRAGALPVVVAANGGSLLERIRRIAAGRAESTGASPRWAAAAVLLSILVLALTIPSLPALAQREEAPPKKAQAAKPATTRVEVVEAAEPPAEAAAVTPPVDVAAPHVAIAPPAVDLDLPDLDIPLPDLDIDVPDIDVTPPDLAMAMVPMPAPPMPPSRPRTPRPSAAAAPMAVPAPMVPATPAPAPRAPHPPEAMAAILAGAVFGDDDPEEQAKDFGASGKLTVDELIQLRAVGVTSAYIDQMRSVFPDLKLRSIVQLRALGVTAEWLRTMRDAGVNISTARDAALLRAARVTPEFVKQLAAAGYPNLSARELARLSAARIDGDFIRDMEKSRAKK